MPCASVDEPSLIESMESPTKPAAAAPPPEGAEPARSRLSEAVGRVLSWATATRLRKIVTGAIGLVLLGALFASWSYFGQVALETVDPTSVELAIKALDEGRYGDAKSIIGQMQRQPAAPELLGGALFVLGAVKAQEAEEEVSPDRRRMIHEIAARYLQKAGTLGVPGDRQARAAYLLGKSLALSGQSAEAIPALEEALRDPSQPATEIHSLLVGALLDGSEPNLTAALQHNQHVLADPALGEEQRQRAWIVSGGTLMRLERYVEARQALDQIPAASVLAASRMLLLGRLDIEEAQALVEGSPERQAKLADALKHLQEVDRLDQEHGPLSRQASLWMARRFELNNEQAAALAEYDRISKIHSNTPEGLTATLAAADYYRRDGQIEKALFGYRYVLREIEAQVSYDNALLPLSDVRRRLTMVYQQCLDEKLFAEALMLVDLFEPVFGRVSCAELRAKTHVQWGEWRLGQGHTGNSAEDAKAEKEGRLQLRAAGVAYEDLARLRFAARQFTEDLWTAGECYFRGQSYSQAARIFGEYLHHEARRNNAMALLRMGQSQLAGGEYEKAIVAFDECVEMYPNDAVTYQARVECARAQQQLGKMDRAEQLLLTNLVGDTLKPQSPEWRDSLFALGNLLYEMGRYDEAISKLEEATLRYPDDDQTLFAKYIMARANHCAAEAPAKRLQESKTENERQAARTLLNEYLNKAHEYYQDVQRKITLRGHSDGNPLDLALLRNCYLMQGSVLFELRRFEESLQAYGNVITSYRDDPIALESFVQVANCWRRLDQPVKARVTLDQAKVVLKGLPPTTDFLGSTNFNRQQWELLLNQMSIW
jgi:tetratricopeptide (TPR) repeat protein